MVIEKIKKQQFHHQSCGDEAGILPLLWRLLLTFIPSCHHLCVFRIQVILPMISLLFSLCYALIPLLANSQGNTPVIIDCLCGAAGGLWLCSVPRISRVSGTTLCLHSGDPCFKVWRAWHQSCWCAVALCKESMCCFRWDARLMLSWYKSVQLHQLCQDSMNLNQLNMCSLFRYYSLPAVVEFG